jgi:hypothetical protein
MSNHAIGRTRATHVKGEEMTARQRAKQESLDQYDEQFVERVAQAEKMIVATLLFPEICGINDEVLPIFERAHDAVHEAAHELADAIMIEEIQTAFEGMTEQEHDAMAAKLLKLANAGRPLPEPDTLEGYCLAAYTDDGRLAVPGLMLEDFAPATARRRAR